jgi:hypothetical protein
MSDVIALGSALGTPIFILLKYVSKMSFGLSVSPRLVQPALCGSLKIAAWAGSKQGPSLVPLAGNGFMKCMQIIAALHKGKDQARKSDASNPICAPARIHSVGGSVVNVPGKRWAVAAISRSTALTKINPPFATQ